MDRHQVYLTVDHSNLNRYNSDIKFSLPVISPIEVDKLISKCKFSKNNHS